MTQIEKQLKYLKPSTVEQARFEYSPLDKIFTRGLDKDDQKEGLFKRLKKIEKSQNSNSNNPSSARSKSDSYLRPLSSSRSESSEKIFGDDDDNLERKVYSPNTANVEGIYIPKSKDDALPDNEACGYDPKNIFMLYLINHLDEFYGGYADIFSKYLKTIFENAANKEKKDIKYDVLSRTTFNEINFLSKCNTLFTFLQDIYREKKKSIINALLTAEYFKRFV